MFLYFHFFLLLEKMITATNQHNQPCYRDYRVNKSSKTKAVKVSEESHKHKKHLMLLTSQSVLRHVPMHFDVCVLSQYERCL